MRISKILFISFILAGSTVYADSIDEGSSLKNTSAIAHKIISSLPKSSLKEGLSRYYSILKPDSYYSDVYVGTKNDGIQYFLEGNFKANPCFAESAYLFYNEIKKTTLNRQDDSKDISRHSRASFGDISGTTRPDRPAGWLFSRALKYTNGDSNKAIALIGLCGHDDVNQGKFLNEEAIFSIGKKYNLTRADLYRNPLDEEAIADEDENSICPPRTSDFYLSRALSKEADIPDTLKSKILNTQYPNRRPIEIASKNYHILNSAFMTCQMIEAGMNPTLAVQVQVAASNLYRGVRLCSDIRTPAKIYSDLLKHPKVQSQLRRFVSIYKALEDALVTTIASGMCENDSEDALCRYIEMSSLPFEGSGSAIKEEIHSTIQASFPQMLAARLYLDWHAGGSLLGKDLPCSKIKITGPNEFFKWLILQKNMPLNLCSDGVTLKDCKEAMKIIETWRVDFDWTIAQHRAGAEFAAKNCRQTPNESSFKKFCSQ